MSTHYAEHPSWGFYDEQPNNKNRAIAEGRVDAAYNCDGVQLATKKRHIRLPANPLESHNDWTVDTHMCPLSSDVIPDRGQNSQCQSQDTNNLVAAKKTKNNFRLGITLEPSWEERTGCK